MVMRCVIVVLLVPGAVLAENQLVPLPEKLWGASTARHLLRRAAFEGTPQDVERLSRMSMAEAVDSLLNAPPDHTLSPKPLLDPLLITAGRQAQRELTDSQRQLYRQTRRTADRLQLARIRSWWLDRMVRSSDQFREKMVLFWHGHFTSGYREVRSSHLLFKQNQLLREHALGNVRDLLLKISSNPAMLLYLDSSRNRKSHPNENYSRELLELFTLGEGNYTEQDIKEAARAFTGWSVDQTQFRFNRRQHDYGDKMFMGRRGPWNGGDIIDIVLEQEACHRYFATKLFEFFCYDNPDRATVRGLATQFRKSRYELKPVLRRILMSRAFYSDAARGTRIKSPVQLAVGTLRVLGIREYDPVRLARSVATMGQQLFQPPTVKGWDGGETWINTATLFSRYNFAGDVVRGFPADRNEHRMMRRMQDGVEAFGFLEIKKRQSNGQKPYDPGILLPSTLRDPEVVGYLADRLLAVDMPIDDQGALAAALGQASATQRSHDQIRTLIQLLMSTPHYQVY
jgi:uncharacterized protein (DUF1800 family)